MSIIPLNHTLIIAEIGVNHNGKLEFAFELIDAAVDAKVDFVKFQTFNADLSITKNAPKAAYQINNQLLTKESQYEMVKKLELSYDSFNKIFDYCIHKKINFLSTAFDLESIDFLKQYQLGLWKIPSGEITNYPYLKKIAKFCEPVILSTGMCDMKDIANAISVLLKFGLKMEQITVLHCNTEYPTPMEDVNLNAMLHIKKELNISNIGYSDHTLGIEIPIAAVAIGASVIEKHFTLDRNLEGPDHRASLEPSELKAMVSAIRNVEKAISGSGLKIVSQSEKKNIEIARKSIVAKYFIKKGDFFTEDNITTKRPGSGISPMKWNEVIGKRATKDFEEDELIVIE